MPERMGTRCAIAVRHIHKMLCFCIFRNKTIFILISRTAGFWSACSNLTNA
jgi:hypothetical protein